MTKSPLKWHGGKTYLAQKIVELMPPHTRYCEPFFGGGAVLFRKDPEGVAEFVNDLNSQLTNFWCCLQRQQSFDEMVRILECTPLSQFEFDYAKDANGLTAPSGVTQAATFFVRYRQSRQGLGKDYCTPTKRLRRGMNENVSAWLSAVDGLPEAHERLRRVEIWNCDFAEFIHKLDSPDTLFYCDPPYLHETRNAKDAYENEMSFDDHCRLLALLSDDIEGRFILSGYKSGLYSEAEEMHGWRRVDIQIDNKASSAKSKEIKTECLWMNY